MTDEIEIGVYGKFYDGPGKCRAYTYEHQPNNIGASRLGFAFRATSRESAGDDIDRGLALLLHLQKQGFGVFETNTEKSARIER